ncbi:hypothetical protein KFK09_022980 [Dendrobium nobile]|uniref:DDT domain-containing protein n=1 Tax=Dendrobium nobile TaxID=94219 RepID=A0A8T3AKV9_DENNO|nr:hypothetical protein KFK09_022980 [Dendrobium nobile]
MAVPPASPVSRRRKMDDSENKKEIAMSPVKRSKNPGVRVQGGRIYDSENGKTCHQCRQKTMDFSASCKAMKREKPCTIKFCHKCLLNRYGEKAEEVSTSDDWKCPKCRGVCNCSFCMKKKGQQPTGILVHTAKLTGFSSVHDLLSHGGENVPREAIASPKGSPASRMGQVASKRCRDKENYNFEKNVTVSMEADCVKKGALVEKNDGKPLKKLKQTSLKVECARSHEDQNKKTLQYKSPAEGLPGHADNKENLHDVTMDETIEKHLKPRGRPRKIATMPVRPPGKPLTTVAGFDLPAEDVGPALQFFEFCNVFSKVLDIKKGQPEAIIRGLLRGSISLRHCRTASAIIQFQIRLLSFILEDMGEGHYLKTNGEHSWLKALGKCLNQYKHLATGLPLDFIDNPSKYNNLDSSRKLRILVFLCDEALGTEALRKFLDEEYAKFVEEKKERNEQIGAAKTKEKLIKQTLKNDLAKAMLPTEGATQLSISEHGELISKIRHETEKAHQEMLESIELLPKKKQAPDAVRISPLFLEKDGTVFWRLKSYERSSTIMVQDIENWSVFTPQEKWFIFDDDQQLVEQYLSFLRSESARKQKELKNMLKGTASIKEDLSNNFESQNCLTEVTECCLVDGNGSGKAVSST